MAEWRRANDVAGGDDPGIDPMEKLPRKSPGAAVSCERARDRKLHGGERARSERKVSSPSPPASPFRWARRIARRVATRAAPRERPEQALSPATSTAVKLMAGLGPPAIITSS